MTSITELVRSQPLIRSFAYKLRRWMKQWQPSVRGRNNVIENKGLLHRVTIDIEGNNNSVRIGKDASVQNTVIYMRGNNHVLELGSGCHYKGDELHFEDEGCIIRIGSGTTVESALLAVTEPGRRIQLGNDCMLADDVQLRTGDSHSIVHRHTGERLNAAKDIIVQDHVWIGANSVVLKGVTIGHNSIIGIGSVVTNEIPPNCIAGGIPARILQEDVDWTRERQSS